MDKPSSTSSGPGRRTKPISQREKELTEALDFLVPANLGWLPGGHRSLFGLLQGPRQLKASLAAQTGDRGHCYTEPAPSLCCNTPVDEGVNHGKKERPLSGSYPSPMPRLVSRICHRISNARNLPHVPKEGFREKPPRTWCWMRGSSRGRPHQKSSLRLPTG